MRALVLPTLLMLLSTACTAPDAGDTEPPAGDGDGGAPGGGDDGAEEGGEGEGQDGGGDGGGVAEGEGEGEAPPPCVPTDEVCDGADNDCDGVVDNGIEGLGDACAVGIGACRVEGVRVCNAGGDGTVCGAEPGAPAPELCNAVDDDCDGAIDEPFTTLGESCSVGVGACEVAGALACNAGGDGVECDATAGEPVDEACDGVDNDCDGAIDEEVAGLAAECAVADGVGACATGAEACVDGAVGCVGPDPAEEACDGVDNDCDGEVDEELPGLGGDCDTGLLGVCAPGAQACVEGAPTCVSVVPASDELCDGLDNDCDGVADNDDPEGGGACDTGGVGACAAGVLTCTGGELECADAVEPAEDEACDGVDDDCDGAVDEGYDDLGDPCEVGVGACRREGVMACADGGDATECDAVAGDPAVERCNGLDDNCDGDVDEPWPELGERCESGVGACFAEGRLVCDGFGVGVECGAVEGVPVAEICDGIDQDCDGVVDDAEGDEPEQLDCDVWQACVEGGCVNLCEPDAREHDDLAGLALPLPPGRRVALNFCDDSIDWMTFRAVEDELYDFVTFADGEQAAPLLDVFDLDGVQRGFGAGELLGWRAPSTGQFRLRVQNRRGVTGPETEYRILIRDGCVDDDFEDDDTPDRRVVYHLAGGPQRRTFCEDDDWTSLYVRPDRFYTVRTYDLAGGVDTFIEMSHLDGTPFLADDDGGEERFASEILFASEVATQYLVRVGSFGAQYGGDRAYTLEIREDECLAHADCRADAGGELAEGEVEPVEPEGPSRCVDGRCVALECEPDEDEDDDEAGRERRVLVGLPICRNFCDDGEDRRVVRLLAGRHYDIETYNVPRGVDLKIVTGPEFGAIREYDGGTDDPTGDRVGDLEARRSRDHRVIIETTDGRSGSGRDYCFQVREACDEDEYEHDDNPAAARHIIAGDDLTDHAMCDPDWTAFQGVRDRWYRVETLNLRGNADTHIEVHTDYGAELLAEADEGSPEARASRLEFQAPEDGDYHVLVRGFDGTYGGNRGYSLYIRPILSPCEDDDGCIATAFCQDGECALSCEPDALEENDRPDHAWPLDLGEEADANLCDDGVDWYAFDAEEGVEYSIATAPTGEVGELVVTVHSADGREELARDADRLTWRAPESGRHLARITGDVGEDAGYRLLITRNDD